MELSVLAQALAEVIATHQRKHVEKTGLSEQDHEMFRRGLAGARDTEEKIYSLHINYRLRHDTSTDTWYFGTQPKKRDSSFVPNPSQSGLRRSVKRPGGLSKENTPKGSVPSQLATDAAEIFTRLTDTR